MDPALELQTINKERYRFVDEAIAQGNSDVQKFYDGAVVFITGGSGFLGKQLIEKLFRSCNIKKVYMLMRPKKNKTINDRLNKIMEDPLYDTLREKKPNFVENIIPVVGDVAEIRLALSDDDWNMLTNDVTMIFHGAATINFVEPIKVATLTNVRGTMEMLQLAKSCKNLKSYVHTSTAYSHATEDVIKKTVYEKFYDVPIQPDVLVQLVQQLDKDQLDAMTPHLIKRWPNTYSFTKAVAEEAVRQKCGDLPICIVRPAIVIHALREPVPGWIDKSCALGPSGFLLGSGLGVVHVVYRSNIALDLTPVDLVNNAIIIAAYNNQVRRKQGLTDCKIYTVTGTRNPLLFDKMRDVLENEARTIPPEKIVYHAFMVDTNRKWLFFLASAILHFIPGFIADCILRLLGKKPFAIKVYKLVCTLNLVMEYYMNNDWKFSDSNLMEMYNNLSPTDQWIYHCDLSIIDWKNYVLMWCVGLKKYILKDGLQKTHMGVRKLFWFRYLNYVVLPLYFYGLYKLLIFIIGCVYYLLTVFVCLLPRNNITLT